MAPTEYDQIPKPGDLIEIFRGTFKHWAVFVGSCDRDNTPYVVHLVVPRNPTSGGSSLLGSSSVLVKGSAGVSLNKTSGAGSSSVSEKAVVKKEMFWDVVLEDKWTVNNKRDKKYKPRPAEDIVRDALTKVGEEPDYNVLSWNCEHFATDLRYGEAESRQVIEAGMWGGILMGVGAVALLAIGLARGATNT